MFDECPECGVVHVDTSVRSTDSVVVCPECGAEQAVHREPLLVVSGAAGTGKSAILRELRGTREDVVLLDADVVWRDEFWDESEWYFQTWLRLCRDIAQSKRPPVLFGAGFGVPETLEGIAQYGCFSSVHYLIVVCDEAEQERRLQARPPGRHPGEFELDRSDIDEQLTFGRWLDETAREEGFTTVDTTNATVPETATRVDEWITQRVSTETN